MDFESVTSKFFFEDDTPKYMGDVQVGHLPTPGECVRNLPLTSTYLQSRMSALCKLPSGNLLHKYDSNHNLFHGKTHSFDWAINSSSQTV